MKLVARWTLGKVTNTGIEILKESVRLFGKLYPEFHRIICINHIDCPEEIRLLNVEILHQEASAFNYPLTGPDANPGEGGSPASGWKLCPPRLNYSGYELWLDNDIVITERLPEIEEWIRSPNCGLISEGLNRIYGVYDRFITPSLKICAGCFGLPPDFDFNSLILDYCHWLEGRPLGHYDEQGLVAAIVTNMEKWILVPQSTMKIIEDHHPIPNHFPKAIHFVGANRKEWHRPWKSYKTKRITFI